MKRTARLAASTLACAAMVAGCSSAGSTPPPASPSAARHHAMSPSAYRQFLRTMSSREDRAHRGIDRALHSDSVTAMRKGFLDFAADQQHVSEELSSITPPGDAARANAALAQAFVANAAAMRRAASVVVHAHTPKAALASVMSAKGLQRAGQEIDAALGRLRRLGYTAGG